MKYLPKGALILLISMPFAHAAEFDELTAICDSCHGPKGISTDSDIPIIAGQTAEFIDDALHSYQVWGRPCVKSLYRHGDTERPKTDMCKVSSGLSEEDIKALAAHYSSLPFVPAQQQFDPALVQAGSALHDVSCETCHEQGGMLAARGPRLAGQWLPYLKATLKYVPTGEHLVPPMMERGVGKFTDEELDALMNFYASQQN